MDYGKWKYRQKKKEQKARQAHHPQQLKEVRLRPKTDTHDRDYKIKRARAFLDQGDRVQFTMLFRGREMAHQDLGYRRMMEIAQGLEEIAKIDVHPKMSGRRMTMVLLPHKKQPAKAKTKEESAPAQADAPPQGEPQPQAEPAKSELAEPTGSGEAQAAPPA